MRTSVRFAITFLSVVVLICVLSVGTSALYIEQADSYCESGYSISDKAAIAPDGSDDFYLFPEFDENGWSCIGRVSDSFVHNSGGMRYYCADMRETEENGQYGGGVTFSFDLSDEEIDISEYRTLKFSVGIRGDKVTGRAYCINVYVITSDSSASSMIYAEGAPSTSELSLVCIDTSAMTGTLRSVRIKVFYSDDNTPTNVRVSNPFLSKEDGGFGNTKKYGTAGFMSENAEITMSSGKVTPDKNGDATLTGYPSGQLIEHSGKMYLFVESDGIGSGSADVTLRYCENVTGKIVESVSPRITLAAGECEHVFPFEVNGTILSYTVDFSGVESDGGFYLKGVRICRGESFVGEKGLGKINSIKRDGNKITFSGTMERETVKKYPDMSIGFYAVEYGADMSDAILLGSVKITTQFDYTADLTSLPVSADTYLFTAGLAADDGNVKPICRPRSYDAKKSEHSSSIKLGFSDAPVVSAFEANASHIIIDVPLDKLLKKSKNNVSDAVTVPYTVYDKSTADNLPETKTAALDRKLLEEIGADVDFCVSAGMRVYLRFTSATVIDGLTYMEKTASNYAPDLKNAESRAEYAALVRFFAERFAGLDGFVIGTDAASDGQIGADVSSDPVGYASGLAEICRITYSAAEKTLGDPLVIVPMSEDKKTQSASLCVLLADRLGEIGRIPFALMSIVDDAESSAKTGAAARNISEMGYEPPEYSMILYKADEQALYRGYADNGDKETDLAEYAAMKIEEFCREQSKTDVVFVSLDGTELGGGRELYSSLKKMNDVGEITEGAAVMGNGTSENDGYDIWDFSDKFYSLGWRAIGVSSCRNAAQTLGGGDKRCLRALFDKEESGAAGILLCTFDSSVDMTDAGKMTFTLAVGGNGGENVSVVIVLGTDDDRAEYYASVPSDGEQRTLTCDLTEYRLRNKVDYVGVMLYSDESAELEIEKVNISSETADENELGAMLEKTEEEEENDRALYTAVAYTVVGVLTAAVVFAIFRIEKERAETKKNDDGQGENKQNERKTEKQYR